MSGLCVSKSNHIKEQLLRQIIIRVAF